MTNKNKLILASIIVMIPFFSIRIIHNVNIKDFKKKLSIYSDEIRNEFLDQKNVVLSELDSNELIQKIVRDSFDENLSVVTRDTVFKYYYISTIVKYKVNDFAYLDCLIDKCIDEDNGKKAQSLINEKKESLEIKFPKSYSKWFPKFENKLLKRVNNKSNCNAFYTYEYEVFENENWDDFKSFLTSYDKAVKSRESKNKLAKINFDKAKKKKKDQLKSKFHIKFNSKMNSNQSTILVESNSTNTYESNLLGSIDYDLPLVTFNEIKFNQLSDDVFAEQWKTNSLRTGSMPYSSCYGSSNYCNSYGCSKIKIKNSSTDVVIMVKNSNKRVIRHVYINGSDSYTINLPDGTYSIYFYNGDGWNPTKKMKKTYCGTPKGGFVSKESVTKDEGLSIYNQVMTYTLYPVSLGNFNPEGSSINEAF